MALFRSGNPTLQEKSYEGTIFQGISTGQEMTVNGTMNKFGFLLLMMFGSTFFSWSQFYKGSNPMPLMLIGVFGGLALAIVMNDGKKTMVALHSTCFCAARRVICRIRFRLL